MPHCYRHPGRETGVSCSNCGRPICPDCMTPTPVGMRCPECSRERTRVTRGSAAFGGFASSAARATYVLIGLNVAAFLIQIATGTGGLSSTSGSMILDFGLFGPSVESGEWYRLVTAGFLHAGLIHLAFNMFALYVLGQVLEPAIGTARFVGVYFVSLLMGSFGALLLDPDALTVGASGAVFGIFGATFVIARGRRMGSFANEIGIVLLINLGLTFAMRGISIGGHLGGLAGGLICGLILVAGERGMLGRGRARTVTELALIVAAGVVAVAGSLGVA